MSEQVLSSETQGTVTSAPEIPVAEDKEIDRPLYQFRLRRNDIEDTALPCPHRDQL